MKIMFYYHSMNHLGGAERIISYLANDFAGRGDAISILVTDGLPSKYALDSRVKVINMNTESASMSFIDAVHNNLRRIRITREYLRQICPDAVVCFGISNLTSACLAKPFLGIKLIGSERNNPQYSDYGIWRYLKNWVSLFVDGFIFQTHRAQMYYPKQVQMKSVIVTNGISINDPDIGSLPLSQRIPYSVCAAGRLNAQKGFDTLITAFAKFVSCNPSYILTIYGEGSDRISLESMVGALGLKEKVRLPGRIDDVLEQISQQQIFVLSSRYEGMPNALIEAMACGCACISTDCDFGPSELINDGENGLLVPVDNILALAAALENLAENPLIAEGLAKNARKIRETNSLNKMADQFYEYILTIANG